MENKQFFLLLEIFQYANICNLKHNDMKMSIPKTVVHYNQ